MDPRKPQQHPFSRNTASPYGRAPFPPAANQQTFPPSSHPPNSAPVYPEHQRRPSGPPYYPEQRGYGQDASPMPNPGPGHVRHQSASSIGHGTPVNRNMPPPSSPQQASQQPSHHGAHPYGQPPPRAPPPLSVGASSNFPSNRELPSLSSLGRPSSTGMSINSILREPQRDPPPSQYPPPIGTTAPAPSTMYAGPTHASPRTSSSNADYAPFRRPQTPEHQRQYDIHDRRANSAGSPPGASNHTPEARRWGTPQTYAQRPPSDRGMPIADERREQQPIRVANPNVPPRPNSQPTAFNPPPSRIPENMRGPPQNDVAFGRREEQISRPAEQVRPEPSYQRPSGFAERENPVYAYAERERQEREAAMRREQERERERERDRERALYEHRMRQQQQEHENQLAQRNNQNAQAIHTRPAEPREQQPIWMRPDYAPRPGYEHTAEQRPPPPPQTSGYEHPTTTAPHYGSHQSYTHIDPRYPPASQATSMPAQRAAIPATQHDLNAQERHERQRLQMAQQIQHEEMMYGRPAPRPQYPPHESPGRRPLPPQEDPQQAQRFLGIQEINRKGRVSPLPQAVQGAQAQIGTPGGEPGIKSEFGRMFSGIGSGVGGARGVASPVTAGPGGLPAPPFSNPGQLRREDLDMVAAQDSPMENNGHQMSRTASRGGSRRRKLKEEDSKGDDEDSNGRQTPSGRGKRAKSHHHNHPHGRHHHHHHHRQDDQASSPSQSALTPFKSSKAANGIPSPTGPESKTTPNLHHHHVPRHHHHHVTPAKASPVNPVEPLPHRIIRSNATLDSVIHLPRNHLGHEYYQPVLKPSRLSREQSSPRGFTSTPRPLPRFEGYENSTFTVRVSRIHLASTSREEITKRKAIWGTDIYSDDSDVVAACIHQGWFRGEWPDDVDVSLLGLEIEDGSSGRIQYGDILNEPPRRGPMPVPSNKDLQITILILPALEKYASTTRFGIRSREWGGKHHGYASVHDGISFMIQKIRWVDGIDSFEDRDEGRKLKLLPGLDEPEDMNGGKAENSDRMDGVEESFERGGPGPLDNEAGSIKAAGRNWWKKSDRKTKAGKKQELVDGTVIQEAVKVVELLPAAREEQSNRTADAESINGNEPLPTKTPPPPFKDRVADMFRREDF